MTEREVSLVLHIHMRSLQITDPYSEDYYYHTFHLRRAAQRQSDGDGGAGSAAPNASNSNTNLPLPIWHDTKATVRKEKDDLQSKFDTRTKKWEMEYKVLGHLQKVNPHRQKQLLSVDGSVSSDAPDVTTAAATDAGNGATTDGAAAGGKVPTFASWDWQARAAVETAKNALLEVDEQRRLLQHPDISAARASAIDQQLMRVLSDLQRSLGLHEADQFETVENVPLLQAIADLGKGRKLLARVLKLLPRKAYTMVPVVLRQVLRNAPVTDADVQATDGEARRLLLERQSSETSLLRALAQAVNNGASEWTFGVFRACVEAVMGAHVRTSTLGKALATVERSTLMERIIEKATEMVPPDQDEAWRILVGGFRHLSTLQPEQA